MARAEHLVDRVVHGDNQRRDRTAIERRQERPADFGQDLPDHLVGIMLAIANGLQHIACRCGVAGQPPQRVGGADQSRGMGFEHAEEIALAGQKPLKPGKHRDPLN